MCHCNDPRFQIAVCRHNGNHFAKFGGHPYLCAGAQAQTLEVIGMHVQWIVERIDLF